MKNGLFEKYYRRLAQEGVIKSALCGVVVGFAVDFVIAFIGWFVGATIWLYLAIGIGVACGVACGVALYYVRFRPTTKTIAARIDRLGLEERIITMTELEQDESYIAMRQREDALAALATTQPKQVKVELSKTLIIVAVVAFVFGASMTTISALTSLEILPSGGELVNPSPDDESDYVFVTYAADEGGYFYNADGDMVTEIDLAIVIGESAPVVMAVAEDGWMFDGWSDGVETPQRSDTELEEDLFVLAFFVEIEDGEGGGMQGSGPAAPGNRPGTPRPGDNQTQGQNPSHGENAGSARYEPSNRVHDGNTPYGDVYDEFYEKAMEELANNQDLTPEQRAMLEAYCEALRAGAMKSEDDSND